MDIRSPLRWAARAALLAACVVTLVGALPAGAQDRTVLVADSTGAVTPVFADHIVDAIDEAERGGHQALVIRMDTPGGLASSMRTIVQEILLADVPVIVWVYPPGSGAASAGYVIATSAHVFAMAPGTNTGAATPIGMEGGEVLDKVIEDAVAYITEIADHRGRNVEFAEAAVREGASVGATEAVETNVADLTASGLGDLLDAIDGTTVIMNEDTEHVLDVAGASPVEYEMSFTRRILQALADPNLAFIFLALAPLAILYEIANPGFGVGAIAGAIFLILALYSIAVLPVNLAGLALFALAITLFVIEAFAPGTGVAAGGGVIALILSGLFLFQRPTGIGVDWAVIIPTAIVAGLAAVGLAVIIRRTWKQRPETGEEAYVGARAEVRHAYGERGQVFFDGTLWSARSVGSDLEEGTDVRVVDRDGLLLKVIPEAEYEEYEQQRLREQTVEKEGT
jgi:membrane-bound serine protease (ClpP class)